VIDQERPPVTEITPSTLGVELCDPPFLVWRGQRQAA
jgi:hypothetical protein